MKLIVLLLLVLSSLKAYNQSNWTGTYSIKYIEKKSQYNRSVLKFWISNDSLNVNSWSFNAYYKDKWSWENQGYYIEVGSGTIELFVINHKNLNSKAEKKILKKLEKVNPIYRITKVEGRYFIESDNRKYRKNGKLELIRT